MDIALLKDISYLVIIVGGAIYTWLTARSKANSSSISQINEKMADHESRITNIDSRLDSAAGNIREMRQELVRVHERVDTCIEVVSRVEGSVNAVMKTTNMINEHLLNQSGRAGQ